MRKNGVLRNQRDFDRVYRHGKSVASRYVVVFYTRNPRSEGRVAFLASRKVGNSVKRNRARRLMRAALHNTGFRPEPGTDYIFVARKPITEVKSGDVEKSLTSAFRRMGNVNNESHRKFH